MNRGAALGEKEVRALKKGRGFFNELGAPAPRGALINRGSCSTFCDACLALLGTAQSTSHPPILMAARHTSCWSLKNLAR
jgi:hypothetical protein